MRRTKEAVRSAASRRFDLWIELDFDNNNKSSTFYQFEHYPDDNKKSQWKKVASKEITMKEFHRSTCKRRNF